MHVLFKQRHDNMSKILRKNIENVRLKPFMMGKTNHKLSKCGDFLQDFYELVKDLWGFAKNTRHFSKSMLWLTQAEIIVWQQGVLT